MSAKDRKNAKHHDLATASHKGEVVPHKPNRAVTPEQTADEALNEALDESFPASDPLSSLRFTE